MASEVKKVIRNGKVAVLYSPGYGAGWSTWASADQRNFALFDPGLVELAEQGASQKKVEKYIEANIGEDYFYAGGWRHIQIAWLDQGTAFWVEEYDGSEGICTVEDLAIIA